MAEKAMRMSTVRIATNADLGAIVVLLEQAQLPTSGVAEHLANFVVLEAQDEVCGTVGLERHGRVALLRSLVVAPALQGHGAGSTLCDHLEQSARAQGLQTIYLLTETAEAFFAHRGYASIVRDSAPPEIAETDEFSRLCPASAVLMRLDL
jgi:amino-acid N-acetyltransferase